MCVRERVGRAWASLTSLWAVCQHRGESQTLSLFSAQQLLRGCCPAFSHLPWAAIRCEDGCCALCLCRVLEACWVKSTPHHVTPMETHSCQVCRGFGLWYLYMYVWKPGVLEGGHFSLTSVPGIGSKSFTLSPEAANAILALSGQLWQRD